MSEPARAPRDSEPANVLRAKAEIREYVLAEIGAAKARVFDAFCAPGDMWRAVWARASHYAGCDERPWHRDDPPRFVADNLTVMRAIDLQPFNVFDLDAYRSPWEQAELLLHRRKWQAGEVGALVLTDGGGREMRTRGVPAPLRRLLGLSGGTPVMAEAVPEITRMALAAWTVEAGVSVTKGWHVSAPGRTKGTTYTAIVFQGEAPPRSSGSPQRHDAGGAA